MKNMTVAMRLGVGFGAIILLLILIAGLGISRLAALNDGMEDIVKNKWSKVVLLQEGLAAVNEIGLGARDMVLADAKESRQQAKDRILAGRAAIGKAWGALAPTLNQAKGKEMMQQILDSRERYHRRSESGHQAGGRRQDGRGAHFPRGRFPQDGRGIPPAR